MEKVIHIELKYHRSGMEVARRNRKGGDSVFQIYCPTRLQFIYFSTSSTFSEFTLRHIFLYPHFINKSTFVLLADLDDVERLIHKFDGFFDNLTQQKEKLNDFNALSSELEAIVQDFEIGARNKEVRSFSILDYQFWD